MNNATNEEIILSRKPTHPKHDQAHLRRGAYRHLTRVTFTMHPDTTIKEE